MKKLTTGIIGYGVVGRRRKIFIDKNKFFEVKYISDIRFKNNYVKNGIKYLHSGFALISIASICISSNGLIEISSLSE